MARNPPGSSGPFGEQVSEAHGLSDCETLEELQQSLDAFARTLKSQSHRECYSQSKLTYLQLWLQKRNAVKSVANPGALRRVTELFTSLQYLNHAKVEVGMDLDQLFGVVHCTLVVSHDILKSGPDGSASSPPFRENDGFRLLEDLGDCLPAMGDRSEIHRVEVCHSREFLTKMSRIVVDCCQAFISERYCGKCWTPTSVQIQALCSVGQEYHQLVQADRSEVRIEQFKLQEKKSKLESEYEQVSAWLEHLAVDKTNAYHLLVTKDRQAGSGGLLVERVVSWLKEDDGSRIFWIQGMPGAGKSVLMSTAIDIIQDRKQELAIDGMAYVYFTYDQRGQQTPHRVYSAILRQLYTKEGLMGTSRAGDKLLEPFFRSIAELHSKMMQANTIPTVVQLLDVLLKIPKNCKIFLVLDGLDEANQSETLKSVREDFLNCLEGTSFRVLASARVEVEVPDIRTKVLSVTANMEDMELYVRAKLNESKVVGALRKRKQSKLASKLVHQLALGILRHASQMFLLVKLHVGYVSSKTNEQAMLDAANEEFKDLNKIYDETWARIDEQTDDMRELARKALSFVTFAKRALHEDELMAALAIDIDRQNFSAARMPPPPLVIEACKSLLTISTNSRWVRFAHKTARDYFAARLDFKSFPTYMTQICLAALTNEIRSRTTGSFQQVSDADSSASDDDDAVGSPGRDEEDFEHLSVQRRTTWDDVVRTSLNSDFLLESETASWHTTEMDPEDVYERVKHYNHLHGLLVEMEEESAATWSFRRLKIRDWGPFEARFTRYACDYVVGHLHDVQTNSIPLEAFCNFLSADIDKKQRLKSGHNEYQTGFTPVHMAVVFGDLNVCRYVLEEGLQPFIDECDEYGRTPLMHALACCDEPISQLLLDHGANPDTADGLGLPTTFYAGGLIHDLQLLSRLVEKQEQITLLTLNMAVCFDNLPLVELLLRKGVDFQAQQPRKKTPLHLAAKYSVNALEMLLHHDVNINAPDGSGRTALHYALDDDPEPVLSITPSIPKSHRADMARLLLARGARIFDQDDAGRTPMLLAAELCHATENWDVLWLFLNHPDCNVQGVNLANGGKETVLSTILTYAPDDLISHLLDMPGIDLEHQTRDGQTLLHLACFRKDPGATISRKLIMKLPHHINTKDEYGWTPLRRAAYERSAAKVTCLLDAGADITLTDLRGDTPFAHLIWNEEREVLAAMVSHRAWRDEWREGLMPADLSAKHLSELRDRRDKIWPSEEVS